MDDREVELWDNRPETEGAIVEMYVPHVTRVFLKKRKAYAGVCPADWDDIYQKMLIVVWEKVKEFDTKRGTNFWQFVYPRVWGAFVDGLRNLTPARRRKEVLWDMQMESREGSLLPEIAVDSHHPDSDIVRDEFWGAVRRTLWHGENYCNHCRDNYSPTRSLIESGMTASNYCHWKKVDRKYLALNQMTESTHKRLMELLPDG